MTAHAWSWVAFGVAVALVALVGAVATWLQRPYRCRCGQVFAERPELHHHQHTAHCR